MSRLESAGDTNSKSPSFWKKNAKNVPGKYVLNFLFQNNVTISIDKHCCSYLLMIN